MDPLKTDILPRDTILEFIKTPRGIRNYEAIQGDMTNIYAAITAASFLTLDSDPNLGSERVLTLVPGELEGVDGGPGTIYTLGLADTAVAPGDYGDASHLVRVTIDQKGRITDAEAFELNSDNVTEGSTNLFFTDARARAALSSGLGIAYNNTTGVIALAAGTSFPGTPATGDHFYRSDRNIQYFYDGTRWLSAQLMSIAIGEGVSTATTGTQYHAVPWTGVYDIYLDSFSYTSFRTAAGEWDITVNWVSASNVSTALGTVDGNGTPTSTWLAGTVAIGSVLSSSARSLSMVRTNVSGAASFFATVEIFYRLVG